MAQPRLDGRSPSDLRPISIETGVNRYAEGSALIRAGNTHVLCTASIEESVPEWMKGKGRGWVTAEYSMLPRATHTRGRRDREKVSGRTQEIQRLVGRALRAVVDLRALGERSVLIDCDVLQADGGTRTASITGGYVALAVALNSLQKKGLISAVPLKDSVSAISVGLKDGRALVDLNYEEDSSCDTDMNFVITGRGNFVELQGTAEGEAFGRAQVDSMIEEAQSACMRLRAIQSAAIGI
ncbi:MAG: ribonuclease PH [Bdellovibrionales bacterium]|nr:ribonuclease PH [Bdellovibrionales bacterium]